MKKLFLSLFVFTCLAGQVFGQIQTPQPSPTSQIKQTVGLTDVSIVYSRPSMKGRTIFSADGLVPHNDVWRFGAISLVQASGLARAGSEARVNEPLHQPLPLWQSVQILLAQLPKRWEHGRVVLPVGTTRNKMVTIRGGISQLA